MTFSPLGSRLSTGKGAEELTRNKRICLDMRQINKQRKSTSGHIA